MKRFASALVAAICASMLSTLVHAGFFIPKGTTMVMGTFSPDEQNYELAHGFDRRLSGAIGLTRVREGGSAAPWRNVAMGQFVYLVHRQPTSEGIFNAYVWAGPVAAREEGGNESTQFGAQGGIWIDFETRLVYTRIKAHSFKTKAWRRNEIVLQGMLAPYKADYEDIAAWGGLQFKRVSGEKTEITPYLRFFQRQWWVDAGVSVDRTHRNNFFLNFSYAF